MSGEGGSNHSVHQLLLKELVCQFFLATESDIIIIICLLSLYRTTVGLFSDCLSLFVLQSWSGVIRAAAKTNSVRAKTHTHYKVVIWHPDLTLGRNRELHQSDQGVEEEEVEEYDKSGRRFVFLCTPQLLLSFHCLICKTKG